jgi:hypothetical protein
MDRMIDVRLRKGLALIDIDGRAHQTQGSQLFIANALVREFMRLNP